MMAPTCASLTAASKVGKWISRIVRSSMMESPSWRRNSWFLPMKCLIVALTAKAACRLSVARPRCGPAHHPLPVDSNFRDEFHASLDSIEQSTRRDLAHLLQGLFYSGERRIDVGRALNVIEAHHRHIVGHPY